MSTLRTYGEVEEWIVGTKDAAGPFGDPTVFVCQLFFRWDAALEARADEVLNRMSAPGDPLVAGVLENAVVLVLPGGVLPVLVRHGAPEIGADQILSYGTGRIVPGVWALTPSLNVEGLIHGFVVFYDVPEPAPWAGAEYLTAAVPSRLIVLPGEA